MTRPDSVRYLPLASVDGFGPTETTVTAGAIAEPGGYYGPSGLFGLRGPAVRQETAAFAHDAAAGRRLWDELEQIGGVGYAFQ